MSKLPEPNEQDETANDELRAIKDELAKIAFALQQAERPARGDGLLLWIGCIVGIAIGIMLGLKVL